MCLGSEQPRRRCPRARHRRGTVHRPPSWPAPAARPPAAHRPPRRHPVSTTTGMEKMLPAEARRHLPLYGSTLYPPKTIAAAPIASAMRIKRSRVTWLADFHPHRDQPGRTGQHIVESGLGRLAHRHQSRWSHRVRQGFRGTIGDEVNSGILPGEQSGVALRGGLGDKDLPDQSASGRRLDQVGAFHQEALRAAPRDLPMQFDRRDHPGRSFGEHRVRLRSDCPAPPRAVPARIVARPDPPDRVRQPLRRGR